MFNTDGIYLILPKITLGDDGDGDSKLISSAHDFLNLPPFYNLV